MRTDDLDRFSSRLEQCFSHDQIKIMMEQASFERIKLSTNKPFWCAVGYRCSKEKVVD
jgi:hypothetical protein